MTWKLYALGSAGAFLATYLSLSSFRPHAGPAPPPQAVEGPGAVVDLTEQADRLRARIAEATAYREPVRDAFRFGERARRAAVQTAPTIDSPAPVPAPSPRPPFALAGVASAVTDGVSVRTAVLSSLRGVVLAREGDVTEDGFTVLTITEESVTLQAPADASVITLRLSSPDQ